MADETTDVGNVNLSDISDSEIKLGNIVTGTVAGNVAARDVVIYNYYYRQEAPIAPAKPAEPGVAPLEPALPNPYRGLFHFGPDDAEFFFGREEFVEKLANLTRTRRLIAVVGASGSGKSSVVLAGLVPKLQQNGRWLFTHFRPGATPLSALATALVPLYTLNLDQTDQMAQARKLADYFQDHTLTLPDVMGKIAANFPTHRVLLIADQFEELYTLCPDEATRRHFLDLLLADLQSAASNLTLVLTLRADFMGYALSYRPLAEALQEADVKLGPMNREELTRAIEQPALRLNVTFEPGLVERILDDVQDEPGYLPLLEFALTLLWERRTNYQLTHAAYEAIAEVEGALARHADQEYATLDAVQQEQARHIFIQLVRPGQGTEDTRRVATQTELGEANWPLVKKLADARLIVTSQNTDGQQTAEVIHEALIRRWQMLRRWINDSRAFRVWQDRLRVALSQWQATNDEGALLRGAALVEAERWLTEQRDDLASIEQAFIQASLDLRQKELAEREAQRLRDLEQQQALAEEQRKRAEEAEARQREQAEAAARLSKRAWIASGVGVLAVAAAIIAGVLGWQSNENKKMAQNNAALAATRAAEAEMARGDAEISEQQARDAEATAEAERDRASAGKIANQALILLEQYPQTAMLLAREAQAITHTEEAVEATAQVPYVLPAIIATLQQHRETVDDVAWSPDGSRLATASRDGTIIIWEAGSNQPIKTLSRDKQWNFYDIAWSPDGKKIASTSGNASLIIWEVESGQAQELKGNSDMVFSVAWHPQEDRVAAGAGNQVILWNLAAAMPLTQTLAGHTGEVHTIAWSPDGKRLASGSFDHNAIIWNFVGSHVVSKTLKAHQDLINDVAWSPNGAELATASDDRDILIWDTGTDKLVGDLEGHDDNVNGVTWSPDGSQLASASYDYQVIIWDRASRKPAKILRDHTGIVRRVAWRPKPYADRLASASYDLTAVVWDTSSGGSNQLRGHTESVFSLAWSSDGSRLASASADHNVIIQDFPFNKPRRVLRGHSHYVLDVAWSPDDKRLVSVGWDNRMIVWDTTRGKAVQTFEEDDKLWSVAWSPNGHWVAAGSKEKEKIIIRDIVSSEVITTLHRAKGGRVLDLAWRPPDGRQLAAAWNDSTIVIYNTADWSIAAALESHEKAVFSAAWSNDGKYLASGSADDTVIIWKAADWSEMARLEGHTATIYDVSWNKDGTQLASASADETVIIWDVAAQQSLTTLRGHTKAVWNVAWSPDDSQFVSASDDATVRILDTRLLEDPCRWLTRNLTWEEWQEYMPGSTPYHLTCPGLPTHPTVLNAARQLAREGNVNEAIAQFEHLVEVDSKLELEPKAEAEQAFQEEVQSLLNRAKRLARMGDLEQATARFQQAKELDPSLTLDPKTEAERLAQLAFEEIIKAALELADKHKEAAALDKFEEAFELANELNSTETWAALCQTSQPYDFAKKFHESCP
ncbi:MAG: AAA family ATPase [Anaerolineae bacterium]|nr:AAA family ATPase [Anaerolineae bacterium]